MSDMKTLLRRSLQRCGLGVRRLSPGVPAGLSLDRDLSIVVRKTDPLIIDVGANEGQTVDLMLAAFRNPIIHAFEPCVDAFQLLARKAELIPGVNAYNCGMGSASGELNINHYRNGKLNSFLSLGASGSALFGEEAVVRRSRVKVTTLDSFISDSGIARVELLKVDTQGFDLEVLRGAESNLASGVIDAILVELNFSVLYVGQGGAMQIMSLLADYDFSLVDFYEKVYLEGALAWCTALFRKSASARSEPPLS